MRGHVVASFNADNFAAILKNGEVPPKLEVACASFGQVQKALSDPAFGASFDFALVWTEPQSIFSSFRALTEGETVSRERAFAEVDSFSSVLAAASRRVPLLLVPTWLYPVSENTFPSLAMKPGLGVSHLLAAMNLRLAENLSKESRIVILDSNRWIQGVKNAFHPKLWHLAKIPFSNEVFEKAASDVKAALRGAHGQAKKLLIVDLDDTLWGGLVGEEGWEKLNLGGHDPIGEAFLDFQRALKSLMRRGVLLAIVSKNDETPSLEAMERHPEMILKPADFSGWRINWKDKAQNIVELVEELHLGLDAAVFIDDSPAERLRVREALPNVYVPEWPEDKMLYRSALLGLHCFDRPVLTNTDAKRTELYRTEKKREELKTTVSFEDWLKTLEVAVKAEKLNAANLQRAAQLLNKTNQMNLSTRRLPEAELERWAGDPRREFLTFRVSDKFGDSGLVGLASFETQGDTACLVDFVLSCRVIGRKVEETMLHSLVREVKARSVKKVRARFIPTLKNAPCLEFLKKSGFNEEADGIFTWNTSQAYPLPEFVRFE